MNRVRIDDADLADLKTGSIPLTPSPNGEGWKGG